MPADTRLSQRKGRQNATINCRVVPGQCTEEVRAALVRALADDQISVSHAPERTEAAPSARNDELWSAIERTAAEFWPGAPVFSVMMPGASDGRILRGAGIPTYGHTGLASGESRAHGKDERVAVKSFFDSAEYLYRLSSGFQAERKAWSNDGSRVRGSWECPELK